VLQHLEMKMKAGARLGLVGGNGAEESTLLRILGSFEEVDGGEEIQRRDLSVAYLPQHVKGDGRTPLEVVRAACCSRRRSGTRIRSRR
jgi:ATP-binding cassette subfamily F protein 3